METLYGQPETVVNDWFVRDFVFAPGQPMCPSGILRTANSLWDLPDFLHYSGPVSRRHLGSREGAFPSAVGGEKSAWTAGVG